MIDLRSDTVTKPSAGMRRAIAEAEVGDDVLDGDPTVRRLEERTATLLGMDRALFFPSGTMANEAAIAALGKPGTEYFVHAEAHIIDREKGAASMFMGMQPRMVRGAPRVTAESLRAAIRAPSRYTPRASLLCLENTHNGGGGLVTPAAELRDIAAIGREIGVRVHLDGARLWNAAAATGTPLAEFARCADATMVSFCKGLGAPVGAVLAGPADVIEEAGEARKRMGGGMRQSGILAAACLYALDHNRDRLSEDHDNARRLAEILAEAPGICLTSPETNIVMVELAPDADTTLAVRRAAAAGVLITVWDTRRVRAVTHLDVSRAEVERAATILRDILTDHSSTGPDSDASLPRISEDR
jgi:threonine aldolase